MIDVIINSEILALNPSLAVGETLSLLTPHTHSITLFAN